MSNTDKLRQEAIDLSEHIFKFLRENPDGWNKNPEYIRLSKELKYKVFKYFEQEADFEFDI